ncbi:MAG: hypothetical protein JST84_12260 [Acidobacteria bacterium]|nr:hypothetical protein [Acidobacteriota bacterium]
MKSQLESNCGKQDLMVSYLYDEASQAERAEFERHQTTCATCRNELQAFQSVRQELNTWEMPVVPHIEVVTPRTAMDALREFFLLMPGWFKITSGLATAAAAALIVFALSGTHIRFGQNGVDAKFGIREITELSSTSAPVDMPKPTVVNSLSREDAEKMIQAAVAQVQAQAQEQTRLQLAGLEAKLKATHQTELQNATMRLRKDHQKQLALQLAKLDNTQRQTLTEWLFDSATASNER